MSVSRSSCCNSCAYSKIFYIQYLKTWISKTHGITKLLRGNRWKNWNRSYQARQGDLIPKHGIIAWLSRKLEDLFLKPVAANEINALTDYLAKKPMTTALAKSITKPQTSGTITKAFLAAPNSRVTAVILATAVAVEPNAMPPKPAQITAAS